MLLKKSLEKLYEIFPEKEFYIPPIEFLKLEVIRVFRGHFNIIHFSSGLKADVYLAGKDKFLNWAINNKNEMNFKGIKLPLAPIEYVIVKKLEYYKEGKSEKHLNDIKSIIENSSDLINQDLLKSFVEKFGLKDEWLLIAEK